MSLGKLTILGLCLCLLEPFRDFPNISLKILFKTILATFKPVI